MTKEPIHGGAAWVKGAWGKRAAFALALTGALLTAPARAADADETELLKYFDKVDVWHYSVDYTVGYSNQDVIVTRELIPKPAAAGELCYIRFDLLAGMGDYSYGFKPASLGGPRKNTEWGVYVHKRGDILNQLRSALKLDVLYFFVEGPKPDAPTDLCARKQAAGTPQAGGAYKGIWSDLVVRGKLTHGWPAGAARAN